MFDIPSDSKEGFPDDIAEPPSATQKNDKGMAKDTAQDKEDTEETDDTEETNKIEIKPKRKWRQKTSNDEAKPPGKRVMRRKSIDDAPPCRRRARTKKECIPKGWPATACKNCRHLKKRCSLAKGRNRQTENPQTVTSFLNKKPIAKLDDRSSIQDDEDVVDQLDPQLSTPKGQSKIKSKPPGPPPSSKASNSMEEGSSTSLFTSRNFDFEHLQQQLKVSQIEEELRIAQQQLQLANSRIEALQKLYNSQRNLYEAQLAGYRQSQVRGQGSSSGKAKERA